MAGRNLQLLLKRLRKRIERGSAHFTWRAGNYGPCNQDGWPAS
jgi:hypothetical protein